jgi:hypothetical protein
MEVFTPADLAPTRWPAIVAISAAVFAIGIAALSSIRSRRQALWTSLPVTIVASILSIAQWTEIRWFSEQSSAYPECLGQIHEGEFSALDAQGPRTTRNLLHLSVGGDTLAFDSTIRVDDILHARSSDLVGRRVRFCVVDRRHREPTWMTADAP